MEDFKSSLISHFSKNELTKKLSAIKEFTKELNDDFKKELKKFVNSYVATIQNYNSSLYGNIEELKK
jgi:predicted mannosyl-3-phosphoglycerate phosphatase (HAD superfamily)